PAIASRPPSAYAWRQSLTILTLSSDIASARAAPGDPAEQELHRQPGPERGRRDVREVLRVYRHVDVRRVDRGEGRQQPPARAAAGALREHGDAAGDLREPADHYAFLLP